MRTGKQTIQQTASLILSNGQETKSLQDLSALNELPSNPHRAECTGWVRADVPFGDPRFGKLVPCECKAQERAARLQRLSGLTDIERKARLSDIGITNRPDTKAMVIACAEFLDHPHGTLTIHGTSGNAKSVALQACVNALVDVGVEAVYITAFDLISYIREAFNEQREVKSESAYDRILRFGRVPFLAIDELDKIKMTDWVMEQVTDLIDRRYRLGLDEQAGTVLAMNGEPRDLPPWIYSRLSQGEIIRNDDSDLRPHLQEKNLLEDDRNAALETGEHNEIAMQIKAVFDKE